MRLAIPHSPLSAAPAVLRTPPPAVRRLLFSDVRWLAGLTWTRVGLTFALAVALGARSAPADVLHKYGRLDLPLEIYAQGFLLCWFPNYLVPLFALMLLGTVADNLPLRGAARGAAFGIALGLGVYSITPLYCLLLAWEWGCRGFPSWMYFGLPVFNGVNLSFVPLAIVIGAAYASHRRGAALAERLHAATMERLELQRRTMQARLQVMQSRIEPAFLLDTLADVSARCDDAPASAERIIDDFVSYLRATLPDAGEEGSTLGRELQVARSYLEIARLRSGGRVHFTIDAPDSLLLDRMAPTLLMPLVMRIASDMWSDARRAHLSTACEEPVHDEGIDLHIGAAASAARLRISLLASGTGGQVAPDDAVVADVRARLYELHGASAASLRVEASGMQTLVVLVLPRERASAGGQDEAHIDAPRETDAALRRTVAEWRP